MKKILSLAFLCLSSSLLFAQSEVQLNIQLLEPDVIAEATLDKEPFYAWMKKVTDEMETYLAKEEGNRDVVLIASLHKDKPATLKLGARPALPEKSQQELYEKILSFGAPQTRIMDYSLAVFARINQGGKEDEVFEPSISYESRANPESFKALSLLEKKEALQSWAREELIPLIAYHETRVDTVFKGVLAMGDMLESGSYLENSRIS